MYLAVTWTRHRHGGHVTVTVPQPRWPRHRHGTTVTVGVAVTVGTSQARWARHRHGTWARRREGHSAPRRRSARASAAKRFDNVLFMKSTGSVALGLNFLHVSDKPVLCCISSHMGAFSSDCRLSLLRRPNTSCSSPGGGIGY